MYKKKIKLKIRTSSKYNFKPNKSKTKSLFGGRLFEGVFDWILLFLESLFYSLSWLFGKKLLLELFKVLGEKGKKL